MDYINNMIEFIDLNYNIKIYLIDLCHINSQTITNIIKNNDIINTKIIENMNRYELLYLLVRNLKYNIYPPVPKSPYIICDCGISVKKNNLNRHIKTDKHINNNISNNPLINILNSYNIKIIQKLVYYRFIYYCRNLTKLKLYSLKHLDYNILEMIASTIEDKYKNNIPFINI